MKLCSMYSYYKSGGGDKTNLLCEKLYKLEISPIAPLKGD